jgi:hypothetical protein
MADCYAGCSEVVCACAYKVSFLLLSGHCVLQGLEEAIAADPAADRSAVAEIAHVVAELVRARAETLNHNGYGRGP